MSGPTIKIVCLCWELLVYIARELSDRRRPRYGKHFTWFVATRLTSGKLGGVRLQAALEFLLRTSLRGPVDQLDSGHLDAAITHYPSTLPLDKLRTDELQSLFNHCAASNQEPYRTVKTAVGTELEVRRAAATYVSRS